MRCTFAERTGRCPPRCGRRAAAPRRTAALAELLRTARLFSKLAPLTDRMRMSSWLTCAVAMPARSSNSGSRSPRTSTCCSSGTGRISETITSVSPRTVSSQSPNSSAFDTVALRETSRTVGGRWMMTSSHTAPRNRSAR